MKTRATMFCLLLACMYCLSPSPADAREMRARSFHESPEMFDINEPPRELFPLVIYLSHGDYDVYYALQEAGIIPKPEAQFETPLYLGMLLVHTDYSTTFVPQSDLPIPIQDQLKTELTNAQRSQNWRELCHKLSRIKWYSGLVMAKPGDVPDPDFIPRFTDSRLFTYAELETRIKAWTAWEIDGKLANPKPGMVLLEKTIDY